jgi:hypothetical protein
MSAIRQGREGGFDVLGGDVRAVHEVPQKALASITGLQASDRLAGILR